MVKKKTSKKQSFKKRLDKNEKEKKKVKKKVKKSKRPTASKPILRNDREIAMDFAIKAYKKFDKIIKAIVLFGSTTKKEVTAGSDIDIIILIDDASITWDQELIAWYREELAKLAGSERYRKELHITTTKLTTWWSDLMKGDPTILNILRYGNVLIDVGGFFTPLKVLLQQGRIASTPEAIYNSLQRAPLHFQRSKLSELGSIEGLFWAFVDSSQAALMAAKVIPPSPEHIPIELKRTFVDKKLLKSKYIDWYRDLYIMHKKINHGELRDLKGVEIDDWQKRTEEYLNVISKLVNELVSRTR